MDDNFLYRNLIVWQKAMQLVERVYALVRAFPADEKYALSDQVRRAVVSIASNIAEGCGRATNKDYAHFLSIARGSLYETMTQLEMAHRVGFVESLSDIEPLAIEIGRMLAALLKKYGALRSSTSTSNFNSESKAICSSTSTSNFNS